MTEDVGNLVAIATDVALGAGEILRRHFSGDRVVQSTKTTPTDVVTAADLESEEYIVGKLRSLRPLDGILAEEGSSFESESGIRWVIDPLDGTVNFLYGLRNFSISIAAEKEGEIVAGVVYSPVNDEMFAAAQGLGSTCNGARIAVGQQSDLSLSLIATGFSYEASRRRTQGAIVTELLDGVRDIRRLSSCALDLCNVAIGRFDAYYEKGGIRYWDWAAGMLIVREARGVVTDFSGNNPQPSEIFASNSDLAMTLRPRLIELEKQFS